MQLPMQPSLVDAGNLGRIREAYSSGLSEGSFSPAVYVVEPTSHCNLRCVMCPQSELHGDQLGEMSLDLAEQVFTAISSTAELTMLYFMGEPLLHSRFEEFVRCARTLLSGTIVLSTNATHLDETMSRFLLESGIDVLICCVDRWNAGAYERIRRGAKFVDVVSNISTLLELRGKDSLKPLVIAKALDIRMPPDEASEFSRFWRSLGAVPLVGWVDTWAGQLPGLIRLSSTPAPYTNTSRVACADLWFKMVVNWKGTAVLCCHNFNYSHPLGTIESEASVQAVWQGSAIQQARKAHVAASWGSHRLCANCREWGTIDELDAYLFLEETKLGLVF